MSEGGSHTGELLRLQLFTSVTFVSSILRPLNKNSYLLQEGLVNVGFIDCTKHSSLCEKANIESSQTIFYKSSPQHASDYLVVTALEPKEIASTVLHQLPDIVPLDEQTIRVC